MNSTLFWSRVQFIDQIWFMLFRYCFLCWSIRNIISLFLVVVFWQISSINQNSNHFSHRVESDLTTLNTLRMFISKQRNLASSIISSTTPKIMIAFSDKVKINKLNIYKGERDELNDWLIQMKLYFAFNSISKNQKTFFVFIYFHERIQH